MKKLLSLILAISLAFTLSGVALGEASAPNVLTIALETSPNLDIHWNAGSTGAWLMDQMYEGLYRVTETGFELAGATSVDKSDDGLTWTYHLRTDAVWSDGKPVTAADYVYSFQRLVNPDVASIYMIDYGKFLKNGEKISGKELPLTDLGVKAVDDYTLTIQLESVCTFFDSILCYTSFFPLRSDVVLEDGTGNWAWDVSRSITNGRMIMTACDEDQEIVLEKNPKYYGAADVKLDKLVVKLIDDSNTTLSLLETGEVDLITAYPSEETTRLMDAGYYHSVSALATNFLLVNTQKAPLSDARVRQALSLSIDREYVAKTLLSGTKTPADTYIGAGFPGSATGVDFYTEGGSLFATDTEKAKQLLADAGFPNGEGFPILECSYANNSADYTTLFEYLQATWQDALGIQVVLTPMEKAAMTELRDAGSFDITPQGWGADYMDASNMLSIFVTGNFINAGKYSNETFDKDYNESLSTMDQAQRMALLHDAERILVVDDCGIIPLYHSNSVALFSDQVVTNVHFNANGKVILTDVIVTK